MLPLLLFWRSGANGKKKYLQIFRRCGLLLSSVRWAITHPNGHNKSFRAFRQVTVPTVVFSFYFQLFLLNICFRFSEVFIFRLKWDTSWLSVCPPTAMEMFVKWFARYWVVIVRFFHFHSFNITGKRLLNFFTRKHNRPIIVTNITTDIITYSNISNFLSHLFDQNKEFWSWEIKIFLHNFSVTLLFFYIK